MKFACDKICAASLLHFCSKFLCTKSSKLNYICIQAQLKVSFSTRLEYGYLKKVTENYIDIPHDSANIHIEFTNLHWYQYFIENLYNFYAWKYGSHDGHVDTQAKTLSVWTSNPDVTIKRYNINKLDMHWDRDNILDLKLGFVVLTGQLQLNSFRRFIFVALQRVIFTNTFYGKLYAR